MATREITYYIDCTHCDGEAETTMWDTTQPDDGTIRIDLGLSASQVEFVCNQCGCRYSSDDFGDGVELIGTACDEEAFGDEEGPEDPCHQCGKAGVTQYIWHEGDCVEVTS